MRIPHLSIAALSLASALHASSAVSPGVASLRIHLTRNGDHRVLSIEVGKPVAGQQQPAWRITRKVPSRQSDVIVSHLQPGNYQVVVYGADPLEILGEEVTLAAGQSRRVVFSIPTGSVEGGSPWSTRRWLVRRFRSEGRWSAGSRSSSPITMAGFTR
jgi:hypothetical protein